MNRLKIILPLIIAISLVGVYGYANLSTIPSTILSSTASPIHDGIACVEIYRADGTTENLGCNHNTYTQLAMNQTAKSLFIGGGSASAFNVISVGIVNYSQTAADTCINNATAAGKICTDWTANGLTQAAGTVAWVTNPAVTNGNVSITKTFTCTDCVNTVINATGLYNTTTTCATNVVGCQLFAEANFTAATLQTNDAINVTWFIWTS